MILYLMVYNCNKLISNESLNNNVVTNKCVSNDSLLNGVVYDTYVV
jgi:hypothetical protein